MLALDGPFHPPVIVDDEWLRKGLHLRNVVRRYVLERPIVEMVIRSAKAELCEQLHRGNDFFREVDALR